MWNSAIEHFTGPVSWVDVVTLLSVIVGGGFAWWQWRQSCRVRRAEHLNVILSRYDTQATSIHFYQLINNTTYGGTDGDLFYLGGLRFRDVMEGDGRVIVSEKDIDSMLLMFSQICYEQQNGTISNTEFAFFCYQIRRTLAHRQIKQYLYDYAEYCAQYKIAFPYRALVREGKNVDADHYERVMALLNASN